jgi:protein-S-isoprenylcysteine O-methyltransferase Ste14
MSTTPPSRPTWVSRLASFADLFGRAGLVGYFSVLGTARILEIRSMIAEGRLGVNEGLDIAAKSASLAFVALALAVTIVRLKPLQKAEGWEPRISAFMGAFLSFSLAALPPVQMGPALRIAAIVLIIFGCVLSVWVLAWLGRSFSVTAQARRLVTTGPYAIVRHPLYLCEEVAIIGMMLLYFSPVSVAIIVVQWMFQLRRMHNEELVLRATFSEYADYAARTPKLIPFLFVMRLSVGKPLAR